MWETLSEEIIKALKLVEGRLLLDQTPVIIMPKRFLAQLQEALESMFCEYGAKAILYNAGFQLGFHLAEDAYGRTQLKGDVAIDGDERR